MSDIGTARVVVEVPFELKEAVLEIIGKDDTTDLSKTLRSLMHEFVEKHKEKNIPPKVRRRPRN